VDNARIVKCTQNNNEITAYLDLVSRTLDTGTFPGVEQRRRGFDHPPPFSAEVKEGVELYLCSPSGPSKPVSSVKFTFI